MKKKLLSLTVAMVTMLVMGVNIFASNDPYLTYGSQSASINVKSYSNLYNDTWVDILNAGRSAWNTSATPVWISTSSSSVNTIEAAQYDDTWYGICSQTYNTSTGYTQKFSIKINARTISRDAVDFSNFAISTTAHEFGHVFWLCDNPTTSSSSLMKYTRDRNSMTKPQTFDVNNVTSKYS